MTEPTEHLCHPEGGEAGASYTCLCGRELSLYDLGGGRLFWSDAGLESLSLSDIIRSTQSGGEDEV